MQVDTVRLYEMQRPELSPSSIGGIVWTLSMRRMYTLLDRLAKQPESVIHGSIDCTVLHCIMPFFNPGSILCQH